MGVKYLTNQTVNKIIVKNKKVEKLLVNEKEFICDVLISGADYSHTESLLEKSIVNETKILGKTNLCTIIFTFLYRF